MDLYEKLAHPAALAVFLGTLLAPVLVGFLAMRRTRDSADYFVGGRTMGWMVVALSAVSSGRSSWLVLGLSGMAWKMGLGAVWAVVGYVAVEALQFVTIGPRLRAVAGAGGDITVLDALEHLHDDRRHRIRLVGAAIIGVFTTAYVAAQFSAGAKTLSTALHLPLGGALALSAAMVLVYMVLGGYVAVAWNDVVRAVIMLVALVVLPVAGVAALGGTAVLWDALATLHPAHLDPLAVGAGAVVGFLGIGLGSPGQPHIVVRYMSIREPRHLLGAAAFGTAWNVLLGAGALCIGLLGRVVVPEASGLPDGDPETIYLVLSSAYFGPAAYGLLVGGVFAAILSTADSQLLVVASTLVRDLWQQVVRRGVALEPRRALRWSRLVVVATGIVAALLAWLAQDLVFWLVLFAWGGLGASLGPALILSLYWRRTTTGGVVAAMVTGTVVTVAWKLWLKEPTGIYELVPAFFGALLVGVAVSLLWPAPREEQARRARGDTG